MKLHCPICESELIEKQKSQMIEIQWLDCSSTEQHCFIDLDKDKNKISDYSLFVNSFEMSSYLDINQTLIFINGSDIAIFKSNFIELKIDESGNIEIPNILLKFCNLNAFV